MVLILDRMAVEEVGSNPARLARAIHGQLGLTQGSVPVREIGAALDIDEIRAEPLTNFEGALITTPERGTGKILINSKADPRRQRFTIGHELGHFLKAWHSPTAATGFWCKRSDMLASARDASDRHRRQEGEANAFAIELLAPRDRLKGLLAGRPQLETVLTIADSFEISRVAAARRYVELHREPIAVVFARNGGVIYSEWNDGFPALALRRGHSLPRLPLSREKISAVEDVDPHDWISKGRGIELTAQMLAQANGHSLILLHATAVPDDEEDGLEDTYARFSRLS